MAASRFGTHMAASRLGLRRFFFPSALLEQFDVLAPVSEFPIALRQPVQQQAEADDSNDDNGSNNSNGNRNDSNNNPAKRLKRGAGKEEREEGEGAGKGAEGAQKKQKPPLKLVIMRGTLLY